MDNKEFDDIIKKKLETLNTNGSEDAWDLFKEKWDNESAGIEDSDELSPEDKDLDAKIKTNMQKLRIPFNSKHWIILKEQLELEALFKKKLFVAKSVELVILAFLVLGILNLWPIQNDIYQIPLYSNPMVASIPVDKETAEKHEALEEARLVKNKEANQKIYKSTKNFVKQAIHSIESVEADPPTTLIKESFIDEKNNSSKVNQREAKKVIKSNSTPVEIPFINTTNQASRKVDSQDPLALINSNTPIASLHAKDLDKVEIPIRQIGFPDITLDRKSSHHEEKTFISFAVGPKVALVNSPFDPIYEIDPYNVINTNFNISAKVQKQIGNIELYAGLGYTKTTYDPRLHEELYEPRQQQYNLASLENIKFKTVNIPVGMHYNIVDTDRYQLYTSTGVDLNVIADSEFTVQDIPVGRSQPAGPPPPTSPSKNKPVNTKAKLSQKEFNKGLLSGGTIKDNIYATASVGLGLNLKTSSRTGIFIEPRYSHFLSSKGIGPNADKVHSVSVDLGFKYRLN